MDVEARRKAIGSLRDNLLVGPSGVQPRHPMAFS
jgi:hypothetical protein